tara:strand:+ start:423 stop:545 length:123 start_codon:yes stop_codon:yes gene_type:complete
LKNTKRIFKEKKKEKEKRKKKRERRSLRKGNGKVTNCVMH